MKFVFHFWPHVPVAPAGLSKAQQVNLAQINRRTIAQGRKAICSALLLSEISMVTASVRRGQHREVGGRYQDLFFQTAET